MKVGIVTHRLLHNYGGTLQAYAMQEVLRRMGHEPVTIDYLPNAMSWTHYILAQAKTLFYYLTLRRSRKFFRYHIHRRPEFTGFMNKHLKLTKRVSKYSCSLLKKYAIEAIIVGSDQVWRCAYNSPSIQPDLFLRFAENFTGPKIAYAASFGVDKWEYPVELTEKCAKYAKLFTAISTREDSGVMLCKKYLHVDATGVLDPTLLLDKEDYMPLCDQIPNRPESYLLAYLLDMKDEQKRAIENFARKNNLDVRFCTSEREVGYSIEEWLAMYRDASFVITNSFHGTAFSIINNKDFYSVVNEDRGADRFVSLLSRFNLRERLISDFEQLPDKVVKLEWNTINSIRAQWQNESLDFIKTHLK